jgi:hypothetical protein
MFKHWIKNKKMEVFIVVLILIIIGLSFVISKQSKLYNHIILPPYSYIDYKEYGWDTITLNGTWISDDPEQELVNSLSTIDFSCDKIEGICKEIQADTYNDYLSIYTNTSNITDWNDNFILADTSEDPSACVAYYYRIDRFTKTLSARRVRNQNADSEFCNGIEAKDWPMHLGDGLDVIFKLRGYTK